MTARKSKKSQTLLQFFIAIVVIVLLNIAAGQYYTRLDLTKEKRYSLSNATKGLLKNVDDIIYVRVYLEGEFPAGLKRLRNSVEETLVEFNAYAHNNIEYVFIDPTEGSDAEKNAVALQLKDKGMQPVRLREQSDDELSQKIIFPWALIIYQGREIPVLLLENQIGTDHQAVLNKSVELLEYKFASAIKTITQRERPKVRFTRGQGELPNENIADIMQTLLGMQYDADTLNLTQKLIPPNTDLLVVAKPTQKFREQEKFKIDQFIMSGGSVLWLIDPVDAEIDSLRGKPMHMALTRDLNLDDQLFKYGVRLNADLVQDLQCNFITLVVGTLGDVPQTDLFPWYYYPVISSGNEHAIVRYLDPIELRFASTIDTVGKKDSALEVRRTPLIHGSRQCKVQLAPARVHFSMLKEPPDTSSFKDQNPLLGVLLEGKFESVFKNRVAGSFNEMLDSMGRSFQTESVFARMIVIGDGDLIKNDVSGTRGIIPLGYSQDTEWTFANKNFILNCIEYLANENRLIETRNKEVSMRLLDKAKVKSEKIKWQLINMGLPLALVIVFGMMYNFIRRKKYAR